MMRLLYIISIIALASLQVKAADSNPSSPSNSQTVEKAAYYVEVASRPEMIRTQQSMLYADSLEYLAIAEQDTDMLYDAYKLKGDLCRTGGDYTNSIYWFRNAIKLAREKEDTLSLVRVVHNLGMVYYDIASFDKSLDNLLQAHTLGKDHLTPIQQAIVLGNIGLVYSELGHNDEALAHYEQSIKILKGEFDTRVLPGIYRDLGSLLRKTDQKDKALEYLRLARKQFEADRREDGLARVLNEIALLYLKDNPDISIEYLRLAKKIYVKNKQKLGLYRLNKDGGDAYMALHDYDHAEIHYQQALDYADTLQNSNFKREVYLKIARLYEVQNNYEQASVFYNKYIEVDKDVYNTELINKIAYSKADYELDQKESQIRSMEKEAVVTTDQLRSRSISLVFLLLMCLLAIAVTVFFVLKFRNAARTNKMLQVRNALILAQKEELSEQRDMIDRKNKDLQKAQEVIEEYNCRLLETKESLEEKVKSRTRELEETYRKLTFHINNTPLAVLEWNSDKELIHWPSQAEAIFGYTADEMLGLRIDELPILLPEDREEMEGTIAQLSSGELTRQYFTKLNIDRSGMSKFIEWSYSVLLNKEGELESILTIANDVSLREQTYRELKSTNKELDTFLYKSSHDLRGPIARMQGIINLGLLESAEPSAQMYFNMLKQVTDELNTLLLRLLMVHNIHQHAYEAEEIPFRGYVDALIKNYANKGKGLQPVNIVNKVPEQMLVKADRELLTIALVNLLQNSIVFSDNFNPYIELDAIYLPSGKYIITVSDNGMGIPLQYQEKIFDMFFQGSTRSTGTGLGLYMARKAAKRLGGDVKLRSENGHTVFEITLPAVKTSVVEDVQLIN